jgi:Ca2+-binding EF-hand superfamily protein
MKITAVLFALLATASLTFAADEAAKKPEGDKPKGPTEATFTKKDANGDGKLTKDEFTKDAKDAAKSEKQFTAKDKDKSGDLSKEEFLAKKEAK